MVFETDRQTPNNQENTQKNSIRNGNTATSQMLYNT